jgi:excisionase family DNA binding protein
MDQKRVSTGQAAKLCSVTPDTILKWIKNNRVEAVKTAGGHYRITKEKLKPYMVESLIPESPDTKPIKINYCWEYHAQDDDVNENCRECLIFKSKAEKCYLLAGLGKQAGHAQTFCSSSCYECEYFHFINESPINVLIISENNEMKENLKMDVKENLVLKATCCGYETATLIQDFRPDYIIIDESMVKSNSDELCKHILEDPRAHGSQIILAIKKHRANKELPEGVCASVSIPFSAFDMEECFQNLKENFYGKQPVLPEITK